MTMASPNWLSLMKKKVKDIDQGSMADINKSTINQAVLEIIGLPTPRLNLSTSEDVRREMTRVYREARFGRIEPSAATKLVFILTQILRAHEQVVLEGRINELEQRQLT
jgi:hypothetical protein